MKRRVLTLAIAGAFLLKAALAQAALSTTNFFNFEDNPVHPATLSPDATRLAVCNLPDDRLEIFDATSGTPVSVGSVTVGLDPVTVRFRTATELWVANYISSSISIIDLPTMRVKATLTVSNEPADLVFAGSPQDGVRILPRTIRAGASHQSHQPANRDKHHHRRQASPGHGRSARTVSTVYMPPFFNPETPRRSLLRKLRTILNLPQPNPVSLPESPYDSADPPPNSGTNFAPALNASLSNSPPPETGMIVKKNAAGQWMDDNQEDWTSFISGENAALSGRVPGWDMPDHDVAVINTANYSVQYATGLMNLCMALGVNPASGQITVVGTDSLNQIRFQPDLLGIFVKVELALVDPQALTNQVLDLNPHLNYQTPVIPESQRELSIGDPRGIVWSPDGTRGYITGMGSGNLIIVDAQGNRVGTNPPIDLGEGPTGMALDAGRGRLYVYNRFDGSISTVDITNQIVTKVLPLFDPTPAVIKTGRPFPV